MGRNPAVDRLRDRARSRAYTSLRAAYPDEWEDLYAEALPDAHRPGSSKQQTRSRAVSVANRALAAAYPTDWVIHQHVAQVGVREEERASA